MAVLRTTNCARHGHPEFQLVYDPEMVAIDDSVRWFAGWLEESVAQGTCYTAGQTCQIGWSVTEVRQRDDGDLTLWEPDMQHMPIVWSESVSRTLSHLGLQKDVVESVLDAEDSSFPSLRESAVICTRIGQSKGVVMERTKPSGAYSGWFCGCLGEDHDHNDVDELRLVSVYEAVVCHAPQILPYLALPPGTLASVGADDAPVIFRDGEPLEFKAGSYLAARYKTR